MRTSACRYLSFGDALSGSWRTSIRWDWSCASASNALPESRKRPRVPHGLSSGNPTPSGTWRHTVPQNDRKPCRQLRASRHQSEGHWFPIYYASSWDLCSTPFGIKEKDTQNGYMPVVSGSRAQRLSASKRRTLSGCRRQPKHVSVLNAFRHQREGHAIKADRGAGAINVLNAFRHQREGHFRLSAAVSLI